MVLPLYPASQRLSNIIMKSIRFLLVKFKNLSPSLKSSEEFFCSFPIIRILKIEIIVHSFLILLRLYLTLGYLLVIGMRLICAQKKWSLICAQKKWSLICAQKNWSLICAQKKWSLICAQKKWSLIWAQKKWSLICAQKKS